MHQFRKRPLDRFASRIVGCCAAGLLLWANAPSLRLLTTIRSCSAQSVQEVSEDSPLVISEVGRKVFEQDKWTGQTSYSIAFGNAAATVRSPPGQHVSLSAKISTGSPPPGSNLPAGRVVLLAELTHAASEKLAWASSALEHPPTREFRVFFDESHRVVPGWVSVRSEPAPDAPGPEPRVTRESATILLCGARFLADPVDVRADLSVVKEKVEFKLGDTVFRLEGDALEALRAGLDLVFGSGARPATQPATSRPTGDEKKPGDPPSPQPPKPAPPEKQPDSRPSGGG